MHPMLEGKIAVVTGASSGNGRAIAVRFAQAGATVVVADVSSAPREGGTPTAEIINSARPGAAVFLRCDVTRLEDLQKAVDAAEELGGLDIMVNNAGILIKEPLLEATEAVFHRMVDVNVKSVYFGSQIAARAMAKRRSGVIINMCSVAGMRGTGGFSAYNMTKGAVRLLTYSMADELGPLGIRVNNVNPGIMRTQMNVIDDPVIGTSVGETYLDLIPARRWGEPEEVAEACLFLASDMSRYVMGTSLVVDGGYLRI
jgi:NAD(P)-dependent dehydrogenase (short-subunit alcohol dehydrogenase family)